MIGDFPTVSTVMVSTPDDGSCGIGTYTGNLRRGFDETVGIERVVLETAADSAAHFLATALRAGGRDSDVVHVQHEYGLFGPRSIYSWLFFPLLWMLTRLRGVPLVLTIHEAWTRETIAENPSAIKWAYIRAINSLLAAVADELVFLSDVVAADFTATVSVSSYRIFPHGVTFEPEFWGTTQAARRELGIDSEATLVVEPGYVSEQKGCDRFVSLARRFPECEFLLAGGSQNERDDQFVSSLREGAPENVTLTGRLPHQQFHAAFVAADLIALPYRKDGQSGVLNWCATYEVPTVGSNCAYFRSLALKYGCLDLVDASDEGALATQIWKVLSSQDRRGYLRRAMGRYKEQNGFSGVADRHASLYRELRLGTSDLHGDKA